MHDCIDQSAGECISTAYTIQNIKGEQLTFECMIFIPHISFQAVLTTAVCVTYMTCDTFQIRVTLYKSLEYFILLLIAWLHWDTIFPVSQAVIIFILPEMIWFNTKKHIHIWKTFRTEISGLLPGPHLAAEIAVKACSDAFGFRHLQTVQDQILTLWGNGRRNTAKMQPGIAIQQGIQIYIVKIIFCKCTVLPVIGYLTWTDSISGFQIIGSQAMSRCLFRGG